jgi:hypothetical protein
VGGLEQPVVVKTPARAETVTVEVDVVAKLLAMVKLVDQIRKIVNDWNDSEDERFQPLLAQPLLAVISTPAPDGR